MVSNMQQDDRQFWLTVFSVGGMLVLLAFLIHFLTGCTTERRANNWYAKHEPKRAEMCHILYPCQDSVHEVYKFVEGETQYIKGDTIYTLMHDTVTQTITKRVLRVDTAFKDKVVYQTDKAEITVLQAKYNTILAAYDKVQAQRDSALQSARKWRGRAIVGFLIALIIGFVLGKVLKFGI